MGPETADRQSGRGKPPEIAAQRGYFNIRMDRNLCSDRGLFRQPARRAASDERKTGGQVMLGWVVTFLVVALIAGLLGFGGIAGASIEIAKIIFFVALVLFLVSAVVGLARGRTRV